MMQVVLLIPMYMGGNEVLQCLAVLPSQSGSDIYGLHNLKLTAHFSKPWVSYHTCVCELSGAGQLSAELCFPIASTSAAAPRLHPLQPLLSDCIHFSRCSPIVSISAAAS